MRNSDHPDTNIDWFDIQWGDDSPLYDDRGLTAAGYELLAEMDRQGAFQ